MINYLQKLGNYTSSGLTLEEKKELELLRQDIAQYRKMEEADKAGEMAGAHIDDDESGSGSGSEDADDVLKEEELNKMQNKKAKNSVVKRAGVSAEVYGKFNKKEDFKPRVIQKTEEQKQKIKVRILSSFLFSNLDQENLRIVIDAMDQKNLKPGENAITQGEDGDCLYVVESGELDCTKHFSKDGEEKYLKTYVPGEAFGELALLYNAPRAATIKAKTDCVLWVLDRETFNNIVKTAAQKKREKYENILKNVEILKTIDPYEIMQICDAVQGAVFQKGDYIIKEGEMGDVFYILEQGTAVATKQVEPGKPAVEIKEYKAGEYFGERALIKGEPRYCNIEVTSDIANVISLDRNSFKRLLGPIEPILQRNIEQYKKYIKE